MSYGLYERLPAYIPGDWPGAHTWAAERDFLECQSEIDRKLRPDTVMIHVLGATASGKSDVAYALASEYGGANINLDPRAPYQGMDIGTAKQPLVNPNWVPQYMTDDRPYGDGNRSVNLETAARDSIEYCMAYAWLPIFVGGAVYLAEKLIYNNDAGVKPMSPEEYDRLAELPIDELVAYSEGNGYGLPFELDHRRLLKHILTRRNRRSESLTAPVGTLVLGMERSDEDLERRISVRTRAMFEAGLENEVMELLARTHDFATPLLNETIGYREFREYCWGERTIEEVEQAIVDASLRYARWQQQELRDKIPDIQWIRTLDDAKRLFDVHLGKVWAARKTMALETQQRNHQQRLIDLDFDPDFD